MRFLLLLLTNLSFAHDLKSLYNEAKIHNNSLKSVTLNKEIAEVRKKQLTSTILPTISLNASFVQLNPSEDFTNRGLDDTNEVVTIRGVQRIFSGLKELYTLQSVNSLITAEEYNIKSQQLDLLSELSRIYFQIYLYQEKIVNTQELIELSKDREGLLKQRVRIGKSRNTELRQAKVLSNLHQLNLQQYNLQLQNLWYELSTLVGKTIQPEKLQPYLQTPHTIQNLDYYLAKISDHPIILSQQANLVALQKEKNAWQSDYFPTISLTSNYYANAAQTWAANAEWDFGVLVSYPIFEGGLTRARVAESALRVAQSTTQLNQVKINLENQIRNVHQTVLVRQQQQKTIEEIGLDNKNNYNEIKKEYSMGLVNNLDVVTALNTYTESLNQTVENSINLQFNLILLKTLVGDEL